MPDGDDSINDDSFGQEFSPIRDHLVNTAVNFLLNPDVQRKNDNSKVEFLRRKGLTDAEISAAFEKAKYDPRYGQHSSVEHQSKPVVVTQTYQQPYSFWSCLSGFSSSLIVFGVAVYGLHYFYQKYVKPWLLGEETEEVTLKNNLLELTENLTALTDTVGRLQTVVSKQSEEINKIIHILGSGYAPTPLILEELKREVNSLKSILISRHQFPAVPQLQSVRASIPSWQLSNDYQSPMVCSETETKPADLTTNLKQDIPTSGNYHSTAIIADSMPMAHRGLAGQSTHETPESSFDLNNVDQYENPATNNSPHESNDSNYHVQSIEELSNGATKFGNEGETVSSAAAAVTENA